MNVNDHYDALGVSPDASASAIGEAYWRLVRQHRDLGGTNPGIIDRLNQAYEILGTSGLRRTYDESRRQQTLPDETGRVAEPGGKSWVSRLRLNGRVMQPVRDPGLDTEVQLPSAPTGAAQAAAPPPTPGVPTRTEAEQIRASTASLVERWRTSRAETKGWAILSDR